MGKKHTNAIHQQKEKKIKHETEATKRSMKVMGKIHTNANRIYRGPMSVMPAWPFVNHDNNVPSIYGPSYKVLNSMKKSKHFNKITHLIAKKGTDKFPCGILDNWSFKDMTILLRAFSKMTFSGECMSSEDKRKLLLKMLPKHSYENCHDAYNMLMKQLKPPTLKQSLNYAKVYLMMQIPEEEGYKLKHQDIPDNPLSCKWLMNYDIHKLIGCKPDLKLYCRMSLLRQDVFYHYVTKSESNKRKFCCCLADVMRKNPDLYPFERKFSLMK